jgi:hypothetical protein
MALRAVFWKISSWAGTGHSLVATAFGMFPSNRLEKMPDSETEQS